MVLEELLTKKKAQRGPLIIIFLLFPISSISIWLVYHVFPSALSILPLAFITIAFAPLLHWLFITEALGEINAPGFAPSFITRHYPLMLFYIFLFLGIVASYALWFSVLPANEAACDFLDSDGKCFFPTREKVFEEQAQVFTAITGRSITGAAIGFNECKNVATRSIPACFELIFFNNFWVLNLSIILSFLYGAGAVFIVSWNASVIGTFVGTEILEKSPQAGFERFIGYFPHGSFEVLGYFFGAIAGGILSAGIVLARKKRHALEIIIKDAASLLAIAYVFLVIGAIIEAAAIIEPALASQIIAVEILIMVAVAVMLLAKKKAGNPQEFTAK
ncbi:MAG: hypothetical protein HY392_03620 [Candidatus Diapherotrites archaeon]|nr:hypothetical protein [Candidatus Diapherotrites archaeon]